MRILLRHRLFLAMVGIGTLPLAVALVALALQARSTSPTGWRGALDEIAASGGALITAVDTSLMDQRGREAIQTHTEVITRRTQLARRAETLSRHAASVLGLAILAVAIVLVLASLALARRWSNLVSAPIEELVDWARRIQQRESLPRNDVHGGAPEFAALKAAMREMSAALHEAHRQELEQERLIAFRETARRVAHEMRGPLTATRLAIQQLTSECDRTAVSVLADETERLERMARAFSDFGRLPEGPAAEIDMAELVSSAVTAAVPAGVRVRADIPSNLTITGHYEPLRRAVQNVLLNSVDAMEGGSISIAVQLVGDQVELIIADSGPGIPDEIRAQIFDPYFTTKSKGTGLGLALVRQTVHAHGGKVEVRPSHTGGATIAMTFPRTG
jgi:signal transduction histidine kinase